jgi:hypothetical protein
MQVFDTPTAVSLALDVPAGHVRVVGTDRSDTTVEVRPHDASKGVDVRAAARTTVEYADGVLRVAAPGTRGVLGPSGVVQVTVQLPAGSHVHATGSGELRGVGRLGDVTAESAYGTVDLDEAASVRCTAHAGDVSVGRLTGPGEIRTAKGDIRVEEAVRGTLVLSTQMGDVSVSAAAGVSASLDAGTGYGRISNALRNDGTAELEVRATTSYGDVTARSL